jgi:DNA invertase Pin-like site-specific DNA recombinase
MLEERGIRFKCLTENIDTPTSKGKLIFHIFGALAEFERNLIRERTQAGLTAARARGKRCGRPKVLTARQLGIALDLYEKRHPRSPKPCCTARSRPGKETNNPQPVSPI